MSAQPELVIPLAAAEDCCPHLCQERFWAECAQPDAPRVAQLGAFVCVHPEKVEAGQTALDSAAGERQKCLHLGRGAPCWRPTYPPGQRPPPG